MDPRHLRAHLLELAGRREFLRSLAPDTDRYKLWLGDVFEFVNLAYGPDSAELRELRDALIGRARPPADASEEERAGEYRERLEGLSGTLERLARRIPEPIVFFESDGDRR